MNLFFYVAVFVQATIFSLLLTPLAMRIAKRTGFLDQPNERKVHKEPIPYLGGAAIFFSFLLVVGLNLGAAMLIPRPEPGGTGWFHRLFTLIVDYRDSFHQIKWQLVGLLGGGLFVFVIGLIDDRIGLSAKFKLLMQFVSAGFFAFSLSMDKDPGLTFLVPNPWIGAPLLLLWMVAVMNSFNLIDNMDGLSGGVAAVSLFFFCMVTYLVEEQVYLILSYLALLGSVLGFLFHNWHPARIFMGDAGSLFLGYSIGALSVISQYFYTGDGRNRHYLSIFVPVIILSVPIFDTLSVVIIRLKRRLPVWKADKNHFSHRLVAIGLSQRDAVLLIHLLVFCTGLVALILPMVNAFAAGLIFLQVFILFTVILMLERVGANKQDSFFPPLILVLEALSIIAALVALSHLHSRS